MVPDFIFTLTGQQRCRQHWGKPQSTLGRAFQASPYLGSSCIHQASPYLGSSCIHQASPYLGSSCIHQASPYLGSSCIHHGAILYEHLLPYRVQLHHVEDSDVFLCMLHYFWCFHNPPNSDMDSRIFSAHVWSFCMHIHMEDLGLSEVLLWSQHRIWLWRNLEAGTKPRT